MEITGKIIAVLPVRQGTSEHGPWMVASYVIETTGQYPKKMQFEISGEERIKRFNVNALMTGKNEVTVYFDIDAHEWQGKWFNQVRAYDVRLTNENYPKTAEEANTASCVTFPPEDNKGDDLPY